MQSEGIEGDFHLQSEGRNNRKTTQLKRTNRVLCLYELCITKSSGDHGVGTETSPSSRWSTDRVARELRGLWYSDNTSAAQLDNVFTEEM